LAIWYQNTFQLIVTNAELLLNDLQIINTKYCIEFLTNELTKWKYEYEQINLK